MKNLFYRVPKHDKKKWFARFLFETNGFDERYRIRPTIRGVVAALVGVTLTVVILWILLVGLTLITEAVGRGVGA